MGDFNRGNRRGGQGFRGRDSGRRSFGGRDLARTMFKATCAECGNECQVPFQPSGDRPVFCSACFEKRNRGEDGGSDRRNFQRSRYEERQSMQPSNNQGGIGTQQSGQIIELLKSLNAKLDIIINVLKPKVKEIEIPQIKVKKSKTLKKKTDDEKV